jgi:hypothetical protein
MHDVYDVVVAGAGPGGSYAAAVMLRGGLRATVRYLVPPALPLWEREDAPPIVGRLSVSRATGGSVFVVTAEQWAAVLDAVGGWPEAEAAVGALEDTIAERLGRATGRSGISG